MAIHPYQKNTTTKIGLLSLCERLISQVGLEIQAKFSEYKAKLKSKSEG